MFVVGVRRSGTNWLQRVLDAHPDVTVIPGETYLFSHGVRPLADRFQHGIAGSARTASIYMDREDFLDAVRDLCDRVFTGLVATLDAGEGLVVERTPDHVRHLELIGAVYPDARIIHIIRDGRDVARSLVSQDWGPATLLDASVEWRTGVEVGRRAAGSLEHYREIRYEDLLANTAAELEAIYRWLGLAATPAIVERALAEANVPSNVDAAAPSIGARKWRGTWSEQDHAVFRAEAGHLLVELGYSDDPVAPAATVVSRRSPQGDLRRRLRAAGAAAVGAWRNPTGSRARADDRRLTEALEIVHQVLEAVALGRWAEVKAQLGPGARLRITGDRGEWQGRSPADADRFTEWLAADPALGGRQVRSTVHPGLPTSAVATVFTTPDGAAHARTWVIGVQAGELTELTLHRHGEADPLPPENTPRD